MKNTKLNIEKKYGKSRCHDVQYYLDSLSRNYGFPFSEDTLFEMLDDFKEYSTADFSASYKKLDEMEFYGSVKRSHIRKACKESKADRIRKQQLDEPPPPIKKGCPMPANIKIRLTKSLS